MGTGRRADRHDPKHCQGHKRRERLQEAYAVMAAGVVTDERALLLPGDSPADSIPSDAMIGPLDGRLMRPARGV